MTDKERPKRQRKSAPKVRTGCLTCKTRHIKCDEEKPTCLRCRSDKFTCDGYRSPPPQPTKAKPRKKSTSPIQLTVTLNTDVPGSALEKFYFHHIRQCTVEYLTFSSEADFWMDIVLPTAHHDASVKHALVALGMAHRLFIDQPGVDQLDGLVLRQYNEAIRHLTNNSISRSNDLRQTLICCLVFFCLESVIGHYATALDHLRSGAKLLGPFLQKIEADKSTIPNDEQETLRKIADIIGVIGVDAGFFLDENIVFNLGHYNLPDISGEDPKQPFKDITDARRSVNKIIVNFNHAVDYCGRDWYAPQLCELYERIRHWATRFDATTFDFGGRIPSQAEEHELLALRLSRKLWLSAINAEIHSRKPPGDFLDSFASILDDAEQIIKPLASVRHPVFTLQADIVPAVAYVCDLTKDPVVQRRAIDLLKSVKRREGIWDSQEIAEYLEDYLAAKELLQMNWDNVPGGVPGSVRLLSGLNMSHMSPQNGILHLASRGKPIKFDDLNSSRQAVVQHVLRDNVQKVFGENEAENGVLDKRAKVEDSLELDTSKHIFCHRAVFPDPGRHSPARRAVIEQREMQMGYCVKEDASHHCQLDADLLGQPFLLNHWQDFRDETKAIHAAAGAFRVNHAGSPSEEADDSSWHCPMLRVGNWGNQVEISTEAH